MVSNVAVYILAGSMHICGACRSRSSRPDAAVALRARRCTVTRRSPGPAATSAAVVGARVVVGGRRRPSDRWWTSSSSLVVAADEHRDDQDGDGQRSAPTMMPGCARALARWRPRGRRSASSRLMRPSFCRCRFSVPTSRRRYRRRAAPAAPSRPNRVRGRTSPAGSVRPAVALVWCRSSAARRSPIPSASARWPTTSPARRRRGDEVVLVVVSAMGKETDELLRLAGEVSADPPGPRDGHADHRGRAQGHRRCVCMALARPRRRRRQLHRQPGRVHHRHQPHERQDPRGAARPHPRRRSRPGRVPVVGGAQGVSTERDVTFLGRGGSDTTAVALAHALERRRVRALHRRVGRLHGRPPPGARGAQHAHRSASTRCWR